MVSETLSIVLLLSRYYISKHRHLTSEPADHTFLSMVIIILEPTVYDSIEVEEKWRGNVTEIFLNAYFPR